jgi:pimeloyl-ACP methyl ester carboxylesterase
LCREVDAFTDTLSVDVEGGALHVARAGPAPRDAEAVVVAAHGITASHLGWRPVARELLERRPEVCVLAPDLRGRGKSASVGPPRGSLAAHAADMVAVLDEVGADRAVMAGHSMGAYVAARAAVEAPGRVGAVVLVDGGLPVILPEGVAPDAALDAFLGPAIERLRMTFDSPDAYVEFWKQHPALDQGRWNQDLEDYVRYDLGSDGRSVVAEDAVRADGAELMMDGTANAAASQVDAPVWLLRAPRGLLDEDPFIPLEALLAFREAQPAANVEEVQGVNHYTIVLGEGASRVAGALDEAVAAL